MEKNEYHHGNLKEKFLEVAFEFLKTHDSKELTLKILSDATGTSRSAIYRHFKSKDELIETLLLSGFEQFDGYVTECLTHKNISLIDRFYESGKNYITFAQKNPHLYRLLFSERYAHIREANMCISDEECLGFNTLVASVVEGQEAKLIKEGDALIHAIGIWSQLHGLSMLLIDGFMQINENKVNKHLSY